MDRVEQGGPGCGAGWPGVASKAMHQGGLPKTPAARGLERPRRAQACRFERLGWHPGLARGMQAREAAAAAHRAGC